MLVQETAGLLTPDAGGSKTAVAVAIAKLGEPAVVAQFAGGGSFIGTGRALSAAAGRLSYVYGLKASAFCSVGYNLLQTSAYGYVHL
jgi:acyl transferase domain-containing protein